MTNWAIFPVQIGVFYGRFPTGQSPESSFSIMNTFQAQIPAVEEGASVAISSKCARQFACFGSASASPTLQSLAVRRRCCKAICTMANPANAWEQRIRERQNWIADSQPLTGHSQVSELTAADGFERLMSQPPVPTRLFHGTNPSGHHEQIFPGFAVAPQLPSPGTQSKVGNEEPGEPQPAGRTRAGKKQRAERARKSKNVVEIMDFDGEGEEENGRNRWSDAEVRQLIAFRSEMDKTFQKNFKKGGRTWAKLRARMVAKSSGFNKSSEAYRKKWEAVFSQYGNEKRSLLIFGERHEVVKCKFFDEIDKGFSNSAAVRKLVHADARGSPNPCPVDAGTMPKNTAQPSRTPRKKSDSERSLSLLAELVDATRLLANATHETTEVMKDVMKDFPILFDRLIDKL